MKRNPGNKRRLPSQFDAIVEALGDWTGITSRLAVEMIIDRIDALAMVETPMAIVMRLNPPTRNRCPLCRRRHEWDEGRIKEDADL